VLRTMGEKFAVAIVGAGPAGSSAALQLARAGISVGVFEQRSSVSRKLGETLPPATNRVLKNLALWEDFLNTGPLPSTCNASSWGSSSLAFNDFFFGTEGCGWHIDREKFERLLLNAAGDAGATFHLGSRVVSSKATGATWDLEVSSNGNTDHYRADFVVDASGRGQNPWRMTPVGRLVHDHMIAVGYYVHSSSHAHDYGYALIEAVDGGWFYSAQLSGSEAVICYMTDADLYARGNKKNSQYWREQLTKAPHTRKRFCCGDIISPPVFASANSSVRSKVTGDNWMAIGDAAMSQDPLSSSGIYSALTSGVEAARILIAQKNGDAGELDDWSRYVRTAFSNYLLAREEVYLNERRWPESQFWARRQRPAS
jgi:flavin-dependent dehydrogenase